MTDYGCAPDGTDHLMISVLFFSQTIGTDLRATYIIMAVILKYIFFKFVIENSILETCCEIAIRLIPQDITNEKTILVQVMAWCHHIEQVSTWVNVDPALIAIWWH